MGIVSVSGAGMMPVAFGLCAAARQPRSAPPASAQVYYIWRIAVRFRRLVCGATRRILSRPPPYT